VRTLGEKTKKTKELELTTTGVRPYDLIISCAASCRLGPDTPSGGPSYGARVPPSPGSRTPAGLPGPRDGDPRLGTGPRREGLM